MFNGIIIGLVTDMLPRRIACVAISFGMLSGQSPLIIVNNIELAAAISGLQIFGIQGVRQKKDCHVVTVRQKNNAEKGT